MDSTDVALARRLKRVEDILLKLRLGEVTDDDPFSVSLGGESAVSDIAAINDAAIAVGDTVAALQSGNSVLVLGATGNGAGQIVSRIGGSVIPVRVASTGNVTVSNPGTAVFDGITLADGERLLLRAQSTASQNGVYRFNGSGSALTRVTDANSWNKLVGALVVVSEGTVYADTIWLCTSNAGGTLGSTSLAFAQVTAGGHSQVAAVAASALAASTYANGSGGVGATLTANANGALAAQDGVTLAANDRLLVAAQASGLQNGIYVVTQVGTAGTPFILTRATDSDTGLDMQGNQVVVTGGTRYSGSVWTCITNGAITVGTTAVTWRFVEAFQSPTYAGAWVDFTAGSRVVRFYRDRDRCYIEGPCKSGVVGTAIFTLPAGYRPGQILLFPVVSNNVFGYVTIDTAGVVTASAGNNAYFDLSGINFRCA